MRIRSLVPSFWSSQTLAQIPRERRLFFAGLWSCADDHGRGLAEPRWLKGQLFAFDDDVTPAVIQQWLESLAGLGVIVLYGDGKGRPLYFVTSWHEHQHPQRPSPSKLPPPSGRTAPIVGREPSGNAPGNIPEASGDLPPRPRERSSQEGSGGERSGGGEKPLKGASLPSTKRDRAEASR